MKIVVSWSSGKDSAWALHALQQEGQNVAGLLTTVSEEDASIPMHHVSEALLDAQGRALELPIYKIRLPRDCPNDIYEARMREGIDRLCADGIERIAFGDLFLEDIRAYRESMLADTGLAPLFPLWKQDTAALAREMCAAGLDATITSVDTSQLAGDFVGRAFDDRLLDALPDGVDPCAENGEFHTFAFDGPMFRTPISVLPADIVDAGRFLYLNLTLACRTEAN